MVTPPKNNTEISFGYLPAKNAYITRLKPSTESTPASRFRHRRGEARRGEAIRGEELVSVGSTRNLVGIRAAVPPALRYAV